MEGPMTEKGTREPSRVLVGFISWLGIMGTYIYKTSGAVHIRFEHFSVFQTSTKMIIMISLYTDNKLTLPATPLACFCFCCFGWDKGTGVGFFFKGFFFFDLAVFLGPLLFCCHPPFVLFLLISPCYKSQHTYTLRCCSNSFIWESE